MKFLFKIFGLVFVLIAVLIKMILDTDEKDTHELEILPTDAFYLKQFDETTRLNIWYEMNDEL